MSIHITNVVINGTITQVARLQVEIDSDVMETFSIAGKDSQRTNKPVPAFRERERERERLYRRMFVCMYG